MKGFIEVTDLYEKVICRLKKSFSIEDEALLRVMRKEEWKDFDKVQELIEKRKRVREELFRKIKREAIEEAKDLFPDKRYEIEHKAENDYSNDIYVLVWGYAKKLINTNQITEIEKKINDKGQDYSIIKINDDYFSVVETYEEIKQKIKEAQELK